MSTSTSMIDSNKDRSNEDIPIDQREAQQVISALKSGVVPKGALDSIFVGREAEIEEFSRCLTLTGNGSGLVKYISGDYGTGKTLLLHKIHKIAVDTGFIVSRLQLNRSFTMNKWEDFYRQMMHHLSISTSDITDTGFEEMFDLWVKKLQSYTDPTQASREIYQVTTTISQYHGDYARAFVSFIRAKIQKKHTTALTAASWIKGETNMPATLKSTLDIKGQVDRTNALDFFKSFVHLAKLLQYNGLVILVDELETVIHQRSDIRQFIYENLRFLIDSTSSGEFSSCLFVFVGTDELFNNQEKGIPSYEPLAQRLRLSARDQSTGFSDFRQPVIQLKALNFAEIDTITQNVLAIHIQAYNWTPQVDWQAIRNWSLFNCRENNEVRFPINARRYIQSLVDILDTLEQGSNLPIFKYPLQLVENNGRYSFTNIRKT